MFEYQINVSANGKFSFRTEWAIDTEQAANVAALIKSSMPLANVTISRRSVTRVTVLVKDDLTFNFGD